MGDGEVKPPSPTADYYAGQIDEERTVGQYVTELCGYYMAIGMPREVFLRGERDAFDDYEKAFECTRILQNQMLHLAGMYNFRAFGSVLSSAFAPKGRKGEPYLERPIPITESERNAEKKRSIKHTLEWVRGRKRNG